MQRGRIDHGEGHKTVIIGSSRMLFDVQLHVWERVGGERPIQLAIEGTSPLPVMEQLADDPDFTGRLVIGVAPDVFFTGFTHMAEKFELYPKETPSERVGQWLSMNLLEPWLAYYDPDFALMTVLKRQSWPAREGVPNLLTVRKLAVSQADRNTHMWSKVENDPEYAALCQRIWAQRFGEVPFGSEDALHKKIAEQIDRAVKAAAKLRARGVLLVFVRPPSDATSTLTRTAASRGRRRGMCCSRRPERRAYTSRTTARCRAYACRNGLTSRSPMPRSTPLRCSHWSSRPLPPSNRETEHAPAGAVGP